MPSLARGAGRPLIAEIVTAGSQLGGEDTGIHQELPGRIHIVLIRQPVGF